MDIFILLFKKNQKILEHQNHTSRWLPVLTSKRGPRPSLLRCRSLKYLLVLQGTTETKSQVVQQN